MPHLVTVLALVCTVLAPAQSLATDDRQQPQSTGWIKRAARSFLSDDPPGRGLHLGPFAPRLEIVSSGGGLAPMLHFWTPDIGGTRLDFHATAAYSIHSYQYYDVQVGLVPHVGESLPRVAWGTSAPFPLSDLEATAAVPGFNVYASARYRDYPREVFYGSGATSLESRTAPATA